MLYIKYLFTYKVYIYIYVNYIPSICIYYIVIITDLYIYYLCYYYISLQYIYSINVYNIKL